MEITKRDLINQAHKDITRIKGKDYAPNKDEIQKWIDDNPQKVKQITKGELEEDAEDVNFMKEITKGELEEEKKKADRCLRIARRKMPQTSAYRSGLIVQCRQGKIWKGLKEEEEDLNEKTDFSKEKEQGLHGWFARQGGKGKSKGWVDCNTCRDGKCKSCGRKEGESRSKYPACRPTPSACKTKGKGKSWGKKSANENVLNEQTKQDIENELKLNEIKNLFKRHIGKL